MTLYHVTTPRKMARYEATGVILPPVRGWRDYDSAQAWAHKTQRSMILRITAGTAYPLPDHRPRGAAWWTPDTIRAWEPEEGPHD
jgi:hypothetical protein